MAALTTIGSILLLLVLILGSVSIYRFFLHPLRNIPGPFITRITSLWLWYHAYQGNEASAIESLHKRYGPIVRVGPNDVNINDGAAIRPIYIDKGGLQKHPCHSNLDIDGYSTIFSSTDSAHRHSRARPVMKLFSIQAVKARSGVIKPRVERMVEHIEQLKHATNGVLADILEPLRCMAADITTHYLFAQDYNSQTKEYLTAEAFMDFFSYAGRIFHLPRPLFAVLVTWGGRFVYRGFGYSRKRVEESMRAVDEFLASVYDNIEGTQPSGATSLFHSMLMEAGLERDEIIAQCKDVFIAGTDLISTVLAIGLVELVQNPAVYAQLRQELTENPETDPQDRLYLSAVVKETLRLGMGSPARLPRIVGNDGLHIPGYPFLPSGTSVSICVWCLHFNEAIYPNAHTFQPERWLEPNVTDEMTRDLMTFSAGARQCIGRHLAIAELYYAIEAIVRSDILKGAEVVQDIKLMQWFVARIAGDKVELCWPKMKPSLRAGLSGGIASRHYHCD